MFDILSLIQVGFARALKYRQNIRVQRKSCLKFLIGGLIALVSFGFMLFQPASTPHHTGFAALSIVVIFTTAASIGASAPLRLILAVILGLVFVEPQILITQTLPLRTVGDGMILGAAVGWILDRPSIPRAALIPASLIGTYSILHFAMPLTVGVGIWFGSYEALVIARYPILILLAATAFQRFDQTRWLLIALASGSLVFGIAGVIEWLGTGGFERWMNETYLAWRKLSPNEVDLHSNQFGRIRGLLGDPVDSGILLATTVGVWLIVLRNMSAVWLRAAVLVAASIIMFTILGTGSRTAFGALGFGLAAGITWMTLTRRRYHSGALLLSLLVIPTLIMVAALANSDIRDTVDKAVDRSINVPTALFFKDDDVRDESVTKRFAEFRTTQFTLLGTDPSSYQGRDAEYLDIVLSYGVIAVVPYIVFWMLAIWRAGRAAMFGQRGDFAALAFWVTGAAAVSGWGNVLLFDPAMMIMVSVIVGAMIGLDTGQSRQKLHGAKIIESDATGPADENDSAQDRGRPESLRVPAPNDSLAQTQ